MRDRGYDTNPNLGDDFYDAIERWHETGEAVREKIGLTYIPYQFSEMAKLAETRYFPSMTDMATSIYWPRFFEKWRDHWTPEQYATWSEADDVVIADQKDRAARAKATADAEKAATDALAAEDKARRETELADLTERLRTKYLATPGASEPGFLLALPRLIETERDRLMREGQTADDIALAAHKAAFRI